jgi:hypothetical protein
MTSIQRVSFVLLLPAALLAAGGKSQAKSAPPSHSQLGSRHRVRIGGISVGAGYSRWGGYPLWGAPYWGGYGLWGYPYYDPSWPGFGVHPGFYNGFAYGPGMGEVKLKAPRDSEVYVDGAYAGPANKLKSMWLEPGVYSVEVRDESGASYEKRIYVLSGKTLNLRAHLDKGTGKEQQP